MSSPGQSQIGQPTGPSLGPPVPEKEERDSSRTIIAAAMVGVVLLMLAVAYLLREPTKQSKGVPPYAANLSLSNFKMSAAENFIGATVSYVDGTITNSGNKTVIGVTLEVEFKDEIGQLAQREDVPLRVLKTSGPYDEAVDLSVAPLVPGQNRPFRLAFDSISAQWNHAYPDLRVIDVTLK